MTTMYLEPKNFPEVFATLGKLYRDKGPLGFLKIAWNLGHEPSPAGAMWKFGLTLLILTFGFSFFMLATVGHASFNTSSDGVNWGMAIATYAFFALMSSGLTMIAALPMVFGFKQFYPIAKRAIWLSIVTLIAGFAVLAMELGHPFRMIWTIPTGMQIMSPMFWMGVFYTIDLILLFIKFYLLWQDDWDSPASHAVGMLGFGAVILASGMLGLVFGSMVMRPMWYGSFTSIYFMLTAALTGAAAIVLAVYMSFGFHREGMPEPLKSMASTEELPKVFATLIGITLVMVLTRFWTGLWSNLDGLEGYKAMFWSPLFHFQVWVCFGLPFYLMLNHETNRGVTWQVLSSILVLLGMAINRYEFIVGGQLVPMFKGNWINSLNAYTPSITEWALTLMGWGLAFALYALGERLFKLHAVPGAPRVIR
jgi:molybdopterin-containing oxidoreductase family membrane subunit